MLSVYQLVLPTPYKVGPVNAYLVKNKPVTLVDTGADTPRAYKALVAVLPLLGVDVDDIERIVLTHSHPDHSGLAAKIAARSGAVVIAHGRELKKLTGAGDYIRGRLPFVMETGIPVQRMREMIVEKDRLPRPVLRDVKIREVQGNEILDFENGELRLMHLPGHSPGHLCLYEPGGKLFISGDFMLPHITPNPLMEPDPEQPGKRLPTLKQYLQGLARVGKMDINVVFPGHGGSFSDAAGVIESARSHHQKQVELIADKLRDKALNTFQISREIYPGLEGWEVFLGLSEIQAHLDLMVEKRLVRSHCRDGVVYYENTGEQAYIT